MENKTNDQIIRNYIRNRILSPIYQEQAGRKPPLEEMRKIQWSDEFETLMRNRMLFGGYRYDIISNNLKKDIPPTTFKHMYNHIINYQKTRNTELLVDLANYCLLVFIHDQHPNKHFTSDDDEIHLDGGSW